MKATVTVFISQDTEETLRRCAPTPSSRTLFTWLGWRVWPILCHRDDSQSVLGWNGETIVCQLGKELLFQHVPAERSWVIVTTLYLHWWWHLWRPWNWEISLAPSARIAASCVQMFQIEVAIEVARTHKWEQPGDVGSSHPDGMLGDLWNPSVPGADGGSVLSDCRSSHVRVLATTRFEWDHKRGEEGNPCRVKEDVVIASHWMLV